MLMDPIILSDPGLLPNPTRLLSLSSALLAYAALLLAAAAASLAALRRRRRRRSAPTLAPALSFSSLASLSDSEPDSEPDPDSESDSESDPRPATTFDGLGLGFDGGLISLLDLSRGAVVRSFAAEGSPALGFGAPSVVVAASPAAVRVWDARAEARPAVAAAWRRAAAGEGRVAVADLRAPAVRLWRPEPDGDEGFGCNGFGRYDGDCSGFGECSGFGRYEGNVGSVVSWCRYAVNRLPSLVSPKGRKDD